jgi:hypothetical protein
MSTLVCCFVFLHLISVDIRMLNIHLRSTNERFALKDVSFDTKVRDLKTILEIVCGIPAHLQCLSYLDEGTLVDSQKLRYYDPVPNCTLELDVWFIYEPIVQAVVAGNEAKVEWKYFLRENFSVISILLKKLNDCQMS